MTFFPKLDQITQKFIWTHKRCRIAKAIQREMSKARGITLPDSMQQSKAKVTKMAWYWHKNKHGVNGTE